MTFLAVPYLGNPERIRIRCIFCHDVTEASGHIRRTLQEDVDQRIPLTGSRIHFSDETVHTGRCLKRGKWNKRRRNCHGTGQRNESTSVHGRGNYLSDENRAYQLRRIEAARISVHPGLQKSTP